MNDSIFYNKVRKIKLYALRILLKTEWYTVERMTTEERACTATERNKMERFSVLSLGFKMVVKTTEESRNKAFIPLFNVVYRNVSSASTVITTSTVNRPTIQRI